MNNYLFNRSLFASSLVVVASALFSAAGCDKSDLNTESATSKISDAVETDLVYSGCGPDAEYKGGGNGC